MQHGQSLSFAFDDEMSKILIDHSVNDNELNQMSIGLDSLESLESKRNIKILRQSKSTSVAKTENKQAVAASA